MSSRAVTTVPDRDECKERPAHLQFNAWPPQWKIWPQMKDGAVTAYDVTQKVLFSYGGVESATRLSPDSHDLAPSATVRDTSYSPRLSPH